MSTFDAYLSYKLRRAIAPREFVRMQLRPDHQLPDIPVVETGADFAYETLLAQEEYAHALLDGATKGIPSQILRALDKVSRRWLVKSSNAHLSEIDRIAGHLERPGAYFLSVNYEWGCTVGVHPSSDGQSARLVRVLDWRTPGLGRYIIAARVNGASGPFTSLTWPGYSGVLQAMAIGRFSAALNQAPMPKSGGGLYPIDWMANKVKVWKTSHETPAHVLRSVFEEAATFDDARRMLIEIPIASPAIYSLAGTRADELCIIDRTETDAFVKDGPGSAANAWQAPDWFGRDRGLDNQGRSKQMLQEIVEPCALVDEDFEWLKPPILNDRTRLAMIADAGQGNISARGFENQMPATTTYSA